MTPSHFILMVFVVIIFMILMFGFGYIVALHFGGVRRRPDIADDDTADIETRARRARFQIIREDDR